MRKNISRLILLCTALFLTYIFLNEISVADNHRDRDRIIIHQNPAAPINNIFMQANNINTVFRTDGIFNYDKITFSNTIAGMIWPASSPSRKTINFTSGIWVGAKINGQIRTAIAAYNSHFTPGNIPVIGQVTPQSVCNDPKWRAYYVQLTDPALFNGGVVTKIAGGREFTFRFDPWSVWPVDLGAPYVEVNGTPGYQPGPDTTDDRPGIGNSNARPDEILFMVYHDYTNCTNNLHVAEISLPGGTPPMGVEIQQISFMFNSPGLQDMYFLKWKIINKSSNRWDSTYISVFDDADVGNAFDDAVGCDSTKDLGYMYNADNFDENAEGYGENPPATGYRYLQSPLIYTGNPLDTAKLPYDTLIGYKLLGLTGFNYFVNGHPDPCLNDPDHYIGGYYFMIGKDGCGRTKINPITGQPTLFTYTGDACNRTGWFDSASHDARFMQNSGPFTMESRDTQIVVIGSFVARGSNNFLSVCALRNNADRVKRIYDLNFRSIPLPPPVQVSTVADGDGKITLYWQPNTESYNEFDKIDLTGFWRFQGYEIYQIRPGKSGESPSDRSLLAVYDLVDSIKIVYDSIKVLQPNGSEEYEYVPVTFGQDAGISRHIVLTQNKFPTGVNNFFINGFNYRFVVLAYGVNRNAIAGSKSLKLPISSQIINVTPNYPIMGSTFHFKNLDTLVTNRIDRGFLPVVLDQKKLMNATYRMVFNPDTSWNVVRIINNTQVTIIQNSRNLSLLNTNAFVVDGILFRGDAISKINKGVIRDLGPGVQTSAKGWTYSSPSNYLNLAGVDTSRYFTFPNAAGLKPHQSMSMGLSWPSGSHYRGNFTSRIDTNFINLYSLRRVRITFGQTQKAYRYVGNIVFPCPYRDFSDVPFKVEEVDPFDSNSAPRQLNCGWLDRDSSGTWNPNDSLNGGAEIVYMFYSNYSETPIAIYQFDISLIIRFRNMDVIYVWWPRKLNSGPAFQNGDMLTIFPYTITKPFFTIGIPTTYDVSTIAPDIGNVSVANQRGELENVRVVPNPYFGGQAQETSAFDRFIKFMRLPKTCTIYIYSLNGNLVRQLSKDDNNTTLHWDLLNTDRIPVASGIYIAFIDAPGIGTKIIKIAVFTPEERLESF